MKTYLLTLFFLDARAAAEPLRAVGAAVQALSGGDFIRMGSGRESTAIAFTSSADLPAMKKALAPATVDTLEYLLVEVSRAPLTTVSRQSIAWFQKRLGD